MLQFIIITGMLMHLVNAGFHINLDEASDKSNHVYYEDETLEEDYEIIDL